jgi:hypothetical protein
MAIATENPPAVNGSKPLPFEPSEVKHFKVTYPNGEVAKVMRSPLKKSEHHAGLSEVVALLEEIIYAAVEHNISMGSLLTDKSVVSNLRKLAAILPVVGQSKPGIDFDALLEANDQEQICSIFFTQSKLNDQGEYEIPWKPPFVAVLNGLNFTGSRKALLNQANQRYMDAIAKEQETALQASLAQEI